MCGVTDRPARNQLAHFDDHKSSIPLHEAVRQVGESLACFAADATTSSPTLHAWPVGFVFPAFGTNSNT